MAKAYKKRSLGRGLSSILNDDENNILDQKKHKPFKKFTYRVWWFYMGHILVSSEGSSFF